MEMLYPHKIDLGEPILGGQKYSYTFTIVNPEGLSEKLIKLALPIVVNHCSEQYHIKSSQWFYFTGMPALFTFLFTFWEDPGLTLGEFAEKIRGFGLDYHLDLQVKDSYIWKPSKWPLILLGGLALLTLGLCLRKEE